MKAQDSNLDQVIRMTGATYRQLDHWCNRGYLTPGNPGSGHHREWPMAEIKVAQLMVRLVKAGISPQLAVQVARAGNLEIAPGIWVITATEIRAVRREGT